MARIPATLMALVFVLGACSNTIESGEGPREVRPGSPDLTGLLACAASHEAVTGQYPTDDLGPIFDGAVARWWRQNAPMVLDADALAGTRHEGARDEHGVFRANYTLDDERGDTQAALGLARRDGEWRVEESAVCTPPPPTPFPTPDPDDPLGVHRSPSGQGPDCYGSGAVSGSSSHMNGPAFPTREEALDRWWGERPAQGLERERMTETYEATADDRGRLSIADERGNIQANLRFKQRAHNAKWFIQGWSICAAPSPPLGPNE